MSSEHDRAAVLGLTLFAVVATALRGWYAAKLGLTPDEAYYWSWSNDLKLVYQDHPPLIAWLIRGGVRVAGETSLGVRLPAVLLSFAAVWVTFDLGRAMRLGASHAAVAAALASILPAPASGALVITPDTPLGLCWLTAVLALVRLARAPGPPYWYALGVALGLGLLAKHAALLIVLMVAASVWGVPRIRKDMGSIHPWLGVATALVIAGPYLTAEALAGFPSVWFQISHLTGRGLHGLYQGGIGEIPGRLAALIGGQIGLLTPVAALWVVVFCFSKKRDAETRLLKAGFLLPIGATCLTAVFTHPEQNWASLGHQVAAVCAVLAITSRYSGTSGERASRRWGWLAATAVLALAMTMVVHVHAAQRFLPLPASRDPVSRFHGWERLRDLEENVEDVDAVICDNYGLAAEVAWHLRNLSSVVRVASQDRGMPAGSGRLLLLEQEGDWGDRELSVECKTFAALDPLVALGADGDPQRVIKAGIGSGCVFRGAEYDPPQKRIWYER